MFSVLEGSDGSVLGVEISGSGEVNVAGETVGQNITIDGSGKHLAGNLLAHTLAYVSFKVARQPTRFRIRLHRNS